MCIFDLPENLYSEPQLNKKIRKYRKVFDEQIVHGLQHIAWKSAPEPLVQAKLQYILVSQNSLPCRHILLRQLIPIRSPASRVYAHFLSFCSATFVSKILPPPYINRQKRIRKLFRFHEDIRSQSSKMCPCVKLKPVITSINFSLDNTVYFF